MTRNRLMSADYAVIDSLVERRYREVDGIGNGFKAFDDETAKMLNGSKLFGFKITAGNVKGSRKRLKLTCRKRIEKPAVVKNEKDNAVVLNGIVKSLKRIEDRIDGIERAMSTMMLGQTPATTK